MVPRRAVAISLTLLMLSSSIALADVVSRRDGEATDNGPLDIKWVSHGHRERRLIHTLRTYEPWRNRALRHSSSWIALFDRRSGSFGDERYLRVDYSQDKGLYARMTTFGTHGPGEFIGRVQVWRPNDHSVRVRFPKRFLGRHVERYEWRAITSFEDGDTCRSSPDSADQGGCIDSAPGRHQPAIEHDLSG